MENSSFLALPYEILSMVIIQTVPESIENISLTCKFLYHASAAALAEHQQLKRRYSLLDVFHPDLFLAFTGEYPESEMSLTAVDYLQNIALDPRLSSYPTSVILRNGWGDYSFSGETNKKFEDKMARLIHIIQEQASFRNLFSRLTVSNTAEGDQSRPISLIPEANPSQGRPLLTEEEASEYMVKILDRKEGDPSNMVPQDCHEKLSALLIAFLPNLRALRIWDFNAFPESSKLLQVVTKTVSHSELTSETCKHAFSHPSTLGKLESISFIHSVPGEHENFRILWNFAALPSLKTITGEMASIGNCIPQPFTAMPLSLSTLILTRSYVSNTDLTTFLSAIESLRNFQYHHDRYSLEGVNNDVFNAYSLCVALQKYAGHSLETLKLATEDGYRVRPALPVGSLCDFKKLTRLEIDTFLLDNWPRKPLSGTLPRTLQVLRLGAYRHAGQQEWERVVDYLVEGITKNLPRLRRIDIIRGSRDHRPYKELFQGQPEIRVSVTTIKNWEEEEGREQGCEWWEFDEEGNRA